MEVGPKGVRPDTPCSPKRTQISILGVPVLNLCGSSFTANGGPSLSLGCRPFWSAAFSIQDEALNNAQFAPHGTSLLQRLVT